MLRIAVLACVLPAAVTAQGIEMRDDRGRTLQLAAPAQRIVALAPHLAEIAYAAGAGDRLVGAVRFSDYPAAAQSLPAVGDAARIDFERILRLAPDLVLAWRSGNAPRDVARLEQLGLRVFVTEAARLDDIPRLMRAVGVLAGRQPDAEQASLKFINKIKYLNDNHGARPTLGVFYEIWHRPLLTVNGAHLISDVIALCGGRNVFAQAPALTPEVSLEAVLAARPAVILGGSSADAERDFLERWRTAAVPPLRETPAFYVPPGWIQRPAPRIAEGAALICRRLDEVRAARGP